MIRNLLTYALGAALVGSVLSNFLAHSRLQAERLAHQQTRSVYASLLAAAEKQRADTQAQRRKAEQELQDAQENHAQEVQAVHAGLDRAAARAAGESVRVRDAAAAAAARARAQCAAATTADLREATGDPIGVLADVLGRADERAGVLADIADRRGAAGQACEREYDTAREKLKAN